MNLLKNSNLPQKTFSTTIKLLAQKYVLNILGSKITATELVKLFTDTIVERFNSAGVFNVLPTEYILAFIKQVKEKESIT